MDKLQNVTIYKVGPTNLTEIESKKFDEFFFCSLCK